VSSGPVIIVKKIKRGHAVHHGGAWKVAYADFVTAMMALFIVLWLLSSSERVQKTVGGYFRDPRGKGRMVGTTVSGAGEAMQVKLDEMDSLKKKIEKAMSQELKDFNRLKDFVNITITEEGLRIELVESASGVFFDSGSAVPSPAGAEIFAKLAEEVGTLPNLVVIEGHTDAKPFNGARDYSNWELSSDRANAARRLMMSHGLRPDQVAQVRGYADQHLRKPGAPEDPSNRRISILVKRAEPSLPAEQAEVDPKKAAPPPIQASNQATKTR
jgi:chemotaxis protein MotB